jgi:hypothetical protein
MASDLREVGTGCRDGDAAQETDGQLKGLHDDHDERELLYDEEMEVIGRKENDDASQ